MGRVGASKYLFEALSSPRLNDSEMFRRRLTFPIARMCESNDQSGSKTNEMKGLKGKARMARCEDQGLFFLKPETQC